MKKSYKLGCLISFGNISLYKENKEKQINSHFQHSIQKQWKKYFNSQNLINYSSLFSISEWEMKFNRKEYFIEINCEPFSNSK